MLQRTPMAFTPLLLLSALFLPSPAAGQVVRPDISSELREVEGVLNTPRMREAMAYVDESDEETIQEWLSLCNTHGPSAPQTRISGLDGSEIYRSRLLYKLFRIYGLENVHIDDRLNVIGVRPGVGDGPTVVMNAHHDNVALWPGDQPIEAFVADGRVWCPAAGDDLMGVTQLLTILRAMNAADIETEGDVWFVSFTGEEYGSPGAEYFVTSNYPYNLDWRNGDILVQLHGGGGGGVTTGSSPYSERSQLRIFVPLDRDRWRNDAVDALAPLLTRLSAEVRDPRSLDVGFYDTGGEGMDEPVLFMNMGMVQGNVIHNGTSNQAWIRFDLRSPSLERLDRAHEQIQRIAQEVTQELGPGFSYHYSVDMHTGSPGIPGWDSADNRPARIAAAAGNALYGTEPLIDASRGCGDCRKAFMFGMPAMSLRGDVVDYGEGGRFEIRQGRGGELKSRVRRRSSGHDVTESAEIVRVWSGAKHGLLFAVTYAGLANAGAGNE